MSRLTRMFVFCGLLLEGCNIDEVQTFEGPAKLLFRTSFEGLNDTVGWVYTYGPVRRYDEGAPGNGSYSLHFYADDPLTTSAYRVLPALDRRSTVLVNFTGRNISGGVSKVRVRVLNQGPVMDQYIVDTTWSEYTVSGILNPGSPLRIELFGTVGGDNRALIDDITVYQVILP